MIHAATHRCKTPLPPEIIGDTNDANDSVNQSTIVPDDSSGDSNNPIPLFGIFLSVVIYIIIMAILIRETYKDLNKE